LIALIVKQLKRIIFVEDSAFFGLCGEFYRELHNLYFISVTVINTVLLWDVTPTFIAADCNNIHYIIFGPVDSAEDESAG
jgi:hypothetical protein